MTNYDIAKEYSIYLLKHFKDLIPILYGSSVFGINGHDLDMCFVCDNDLLKEELDELIEITKFYHHKYDLIVDQEVPYENKLIYSKKFIDETIANGPFPLVNGRYQIPKIIKTKEFLSSFKMKKRLLLNILTTKHIVIVNDNNVIKRYSKMAYEYIIKVLISYAQLDCFTENELLQVFIEDPFSSVNGELYLGYKTNFIERVEFLQKKINESLNNMLIDGLLSLDASKHYIKKW